jgi:hypothetical protein
MVRIRYKTQKFLSWGKGSIGAVEPQGAVSVSLLEPEPEPHQINSTLCKLIERGRSRSRILSHSGANDAAPNTE